MISRLLLALGILVAVIVGRADAAPSQWIEVTGYAAVSGKDDRDSARRRALADALFNAALAGGAEVRGHTAVSKSVVTSDLTIVRSVGRVYEHKIVGQNEANGLWTVIILARVGVGGDPFCQSPHKMLISIYSPKTQVSTNVPPWSLALVGTVLQDVIEQISSHPSVEVLRVTQRGMPPAGLNEAMDYEVLTRGSVRLHPGEIGLIPMVQALPLAGGSQGVTLKLDLHLITADGAEDRIILQNSANLGTSKFLGRLSELTRRDRQKMAALLTDGLPEKLEIELRKRACEPMVANLAKSDGKLVVALGRRHGMTRGTIAFTADRDHSSELLEVVSVSDRSTVLRPLDPGLRLSDLVGRPVRFVEAAW